MWFQLSTQHSLPFFLNHHPYILQDPFLAYISSPDTNLFISCLPQLTDFIGQSNSLCSVKNDTSVQRVERLERTTRSVLKRLKHIMFSSFLLCYFFLIKYLLSHTLTTKQISAVHPFLLTSLQFMANDIYKVRCTYASWKIIGSFFPLDLTKLMSSDQATAFQNRSPPDYDVPSASAQYIRHIYPQEGLSIYSGCKTYFQFVDTIGSGVFEVFTQFYTDEPLPAVFIFNTCYSMLKAIRGVSLLFFFFPSSNDNVLDLDFSL